MRQELELFIPARYILQALLSGLLHENSEQRLLGLLEQKSLSLSDLEQVDARIPIQWISHMIPKNQEASPFLLAVQFGDAVRLTSQGDLSLVLMTSASMREALEATSYLYLHSNVLDLKFYESETHGYLVFDIHTNDQFLDAIVLLYCQAAIHRLTSIISGVTPRCSANLACEKPQNFNSLSISYIENWSFDQPISSLIFEKEFLSCPSLFADPVEHALSKRACESALALKNPKDNLMKSVQQLMENENTWEQEEIAGRLHLSRSTLKRRLSEQGITFSELVIRVRKQQSVRLLSTTNHSLQQIAEMLGYSDQSSFSHAFKSWFDQAPRDYIKSTLLD